ncbi:MAG: hypothetical protein L0H55_15955 [Candidatus Nitrosocosmicus sp.]|nr:hypothetical protein [Candidatus Nitrosocosmicus sp.]
MKISFEQTAIVISMIPDLNKTSISKLNESENAQDTFNKFLTSLGIIGGTIAEVLEHPGLK